MKITRLSKGPLCWTLEQWAIRVAFSELSFGIVVAVVCFYLSSIADDLGSSTSNGDLQDAYSVVKGIYIGIGVIFLIPPVFSIILLVGIYKSTKILLLIWCFYAIAGCFLFFIFLVGISVLLFIGGSIGLGVFILIVALIVTGHLYHSFLVVYSIYLKLKEGPVITSYPQNS